MNKSIQLLIIQIILLVILLIIILYLIRFNHMLKLEKRISKYAIDLDKTEPISLYDGIYKVYNIIRKFLTKILLKIKIFNKFSSHYLKYMDYTDKNEQVPMDYVSNKFIFSIIFLLINVLARIIQNRFPTIIELFIALLVGFFVPDIFVIIREHIKRKNIERDMLNAIIIMNNAFKSGRSTMQAIEIVKNELDGPIREEFDKMHKEIAYGLSLEVVFKRFSDRINLEEAKYVSSSLTILNKTGGNIVKVFSSIERSLFSKRKLELELKSLTSSSNALSKALLLLPFIFGGIIFAINPKYFNPLFESTVGIIVFVVIVLFYALYILFVQRVMRVRM